MGKLINEIVIEYAKKHGFDLIGFADADNLTREVDHLKEWLKRKYNSGMKYMERNAENRLDTSKILPNVKSVISLAVNYYSEGNYSNDEKFGKVSRYAWGKDYHLVLWEALASLIADLQNIDETFQTKSYVDTGPVMDKAWAVRAGIGWLGKHTNVISREIGSWFFIANIFTNVKLDYNQPVEDFCGSCTACIDACPTNAIVMEYVVDANKCISNLTIENKGDIPGEFAGKFDGWLFGCDICQDVCPWNNKFSTVTNKKEFLPGMNKEINLDEIEKMTNAQFKKRFAISPISRARLKGLKRNAVFLKRENFNCKF